MATILTKKSDTASAVPLAADLTNAAGGAELAVNATDKRLFSKTSGGTVVELGTNPSTLVLPSGSANGVAYLNGSKVVTSGSALTFDGTNFANTGNITAGTTGSGANLVAYASTYTSNGMVRLFGTDGNNKVEFGAASATTAFLTARAGVSMIFGANDAEQMRLTSTGLGIGTSSPTTKLDVAGVVRATGAGPSLISVEGSGQLYAAVQLQATSSGGKNWSLISNATSSPLGAAGSLSFRDSSVGTTHMTLDSSGNLGLGVTPSAWAASQNAFQIGNAGGINSSNSSQVILSANRYYANSGDRYINTAFASLYQQVSGQHQFYTAPSGTAGNAITFTQAMTLGADGNLGVGTTGATYRIEGWIASSGTLQNGLNITNGANADFTVRIKTNETWVGPTTNTPLIFANNNNTERCRIDSSGNLLVGTTSFGSTAVGFGISGDISSSSRGACISIINSSVNGNTTYEAYSLSASAYRFYVGMGGTVYATSTTITAISDQRLKENIRDLDEGLATVMALKPRKFDWKSGKGADIKNARGFIAQEFETVLPDMIETWRDPAPEGEEPYKAINANLIPTLVKAIQELKAEFDAYKASHP